MQVSSIHTIKQTAIAPKLTLCLVLLAATACQTTALAPAANSASAAPMALVGSQSSSAPRQMPEATQPVPAQAASPAAQYVYLTTLQYLSESTSPAFYEALEAISADALQQPPTAPTSLDQLARDMSDPLMLQADPASIVATARTLLDLGRQHGDELAAARATLLADNPDLADPQIEKDVLDYGVRFRFGLTQALYAVDLKALPRDQQAAIDGYRAGTFGLRSDLELLQFDLDLTELTDTARTQYLQAVAALERGVLDELDPYSFEEDGKRARELSDRAGRSMAEGMRSMYFQILLIIGLATL